MATAPTYLGRGNDDETPMPIPRPSSPSQDEARPLLNRDASSPSRPSSASPSRLTDSNPRHLDRQNVVVLVITTIFLAELGVAILIPALNSMLEDMVCQGYVPRLSTGASLADDPRCKVPQVQTRLAMLRGWQATLECIPAVLCAVPFGIMADRVGRKPVLLIAWLGLCLNLVWYDVVFLFRGALPPWTTWFGAAFLFIGGFPSVGPAMIYTILADVTPQGDRASIFFALGAALMSAELLGNPIAGFLLLVGTPMTLVVGLALVIIGGLIIIFLPETLGLSKKLDGDGDESSDTSESSTGDLSFWQLLMRNVRTGAEEIGTFIVGNKRIVALIIPVVFIVVGKFANELLLQYSTKRYEWTWSQASFLMTIKSTSTLVLYLLILPGLSTLLLKRFHMSAVSKDLFLTRASGVVLIIGALMIALAYKPAILVVALIINSLGGGISLALRSLLNAFVESHHIAMLNTLISILEFGGVMVASPLLFASLGKGIELGGAWVGLPYFLAAAGFAIATTIVFLFRLPPALRLPDQV